MKTTYPKKGTIDEKFYLIDGEGQVLGRLAARAASVIRGKHKPTYHPAVDTGDYVIIVNADKVRLTGRKLEQKIYYRHTGYPGGLKETKYKDLMATKPEFAVQKAVKGMLPHNKLGRKLLKKLKVYAGPDHPHASQKPIKVNME